MAFQYDTPTVENERQAGKDGDQTGSGASTAPGGGDARAQTTYEQTHGADSYPGVRSGGEADKAGAVAGDEPGNETGLNADTPAAGDVDPDSTQSAEETGQDGDPTERKKSMGHPWNG